MEASIKAFGAILLLYMAVLPYFVVGSDISCKMVSGDYCKFSLGGNTTGTIDLTSVFSKGPLEVKSGGNDYHYDACKEVACDGGTCGNHGNCVACQKASNSINYGIGDISTVSCDASQSEPSQNKWTIKLSYTGGTGSRKSDFTFMYSPKDTTPEMTFDKEHPGLDYHLTVIADFGVPGSSTPTNPSDTLDKVGIPGIVLIFLLMVAIVAYVVIGMIVNATVRGARGVEMIPNLNFWKDFPFLLKDGFLFTFTCPCLREKYTSMN